MGGWEFNSSSNLTMLLLRSNIIPKLPLHSDIFSRFFPTHPFPLDEFCSVYRKLFT